MPANPFVGTWRLVSAETKTASGEFSHPLGKDATGYLIDSSDGYPVRVALTCLRPLSKYNV
jgi:Lipocalin-like domain